ncbi:CRE-CLEC-110 protein [Caenorhabditis remanei]|uniref:CRE-CLEC-110 protein n=1 Tax=Caenorhabditis remanei TaxID=31234 RepID=E3MZ64_CAERE|nr:CRE-CLEC-110 protein [Caenorhabditis remanei]
MRKLILYLALFGIASAIVVSGGGGGRGGRRRGGRQFSSSSSVSSHSSSEEHGGHRPPGRPPVRRSTQPPTPECDSGWLRFVRPNGVWCVLVGNSGVVNGYMSQPDAEVVCSRYGATLTGFQNSEERMKVADEALKQLAPLNQQIAGLWIGATNNPGCRVASCGPFATFRWTDGHTTGTDGFSWSRDEPDGNNWPGPTACIQQIIMAPNYVTGPNDYASWMTYFRHGAFDKFQCVSPALPVTRMYACGKPGVSR